MDCCGTAFCENDRIQWLVYECGSLNTPVSVGRIDYCYEAYSSDWTRLYVFGKNFTEDKYGGQISKKSGEHGSRRIYC